MVFALLCTFAVIGWWIHYEKQSWNIKILLGMLH